jgi:tetratricopeptide (TPR) repeat protein
MTTYLASRGLALVLLVLALSPPLRAQLSPAIETRFYEASEAMRQGQLEQAAEGFSSVVKVSPTFAEAYLNLGLVREEQGRHSEAIGNFQKALQIKPRLRGANLFLGIAEFRINHLDLALTALNKETAANPKDANAWMWVGVVAMEKGDGEHAADALDKAAKLAPDNVDILYHRGRAHLFVSNESYSRMFKADPKSWRVRQLLAEANADAERHMDAIAEYQAAIKLAPNEPRLHEELGTEFRIAGKIPEAEEAYRQELEIDPDNVVAKYKLGVIVTERGDARTGKQLIEEALRVRPNLRNADYNLGRAEMLLGNDAAAVEDFQRAIKADSDPDILELAWYQLGIVYRRLHRTEDARQALATFQRLKDESTESENKLFEKRRGARSEESLPPEKPQEPQ